MAKGQYLSKRQEGIVHRYYEHLDSTALGKLGELVSDLYLAADAKQQDRLWGQVRTALDKTAANDAQVSKILTERNLQGLAGLLGELQVGPKKGAGVSGLGSGGKSDSGTQASGTGASASNAPTGTPPATPTASPPPSASAPGHTNPETLRFALKAFRKRIKLNRLDEESKLGRSPLTGGQRSRIVAIQPPNQFPAAVWEELANQGKLKRAGRGFYELVEP